MPLVRTASAFPLAVLSTLTVASITQSQFAIAGSDAAGGATPLFANLTITGEDLMALAPSLGPVLAITLALGFLAATALKRATKSSAVAVYPVAGFFGMSLALGLMHVAFQAAPLAGAQTLVGFVAVSLAGALGGWVFARVLPPRLTR